jgi:NAD(P)-dependent dehydrogenase (short-subunit alcohol dehydrogenase family)
VPRAAAAAAALTALPPGLSCPFAIVGKVARAVLPAELTGPRGLFAIHREVTGIRCTSLFGHFSTPHIATSDVAFGFRPPHQRAGVARVVFTITVKPAPNVCSAAQLGCAVRVTNDQCSFEDARMSQTLPPQRQDRQPGRESEMRPQPRAEMEQYRGAQRLAGKVALVSGGDSGIGRAVAIGFAKEGANVAITYLDEHEDAQQTLGLIEAAGSRGLVIAGDLGNSDFAREAARRVVELFGRVDILVNNAAEQHLSHRIEDISDEQLERTFRTNIFSQFYLTRAVLPHMPDGGAIINTASVTAYQGNPGLLDYSATKGAIVAFTRSLSKQLLQRGIRVNGVAPGPIWTPLIPASFPEEKTAEHGASAPMARPGQPDEVAPCYIFLASNDASYMSGQVLHPNGGTVVNG